MDRHLAAIVVVDVVGYSKMMSQDEADTLSRVFALREQVIDPAIVDGGGRIVKGTGDGVIAEFRSAVDAVLASIDVSSLPSPDEIKAKAEKIAALKSQDDTAPPSP